MRLIKRYPNRKLYDTEKKEYTTLKGIAALIRDGTETKVVDNVTGEDLTAVTLTQIILTEGKEQSDYPPRSLLADLIQTGGERVSALQRSLLSSVNILHNFEDEIQRVLEKFGVPNQEDMKRLNHQLDILTTKLEELEDQSKRS